MVSNSQVTRTRKRPEERRAEILREATRIALEEGLEKITLRAIAERLGVRPGLISHYFPVAEDLVLEAFGLAITEEREALHSGEGTPLERMAALVRWVEQGAGSGLERLWLNARHLCRFYPALDDALEDQEALDRAYMLSLIEDGLEAGDFVGIDAYTATVQILIAIDGVGTYANNTRPFEHVAFTHFVRDATERYLALEAGVLTAAIAALDDRVPLDVPSE